MTTYVFVGPTIAAPEARQWLDATYLPPVSQGDICSLLRRDPRIIGIIDGCFESVPSVWHKEILLALSKGVQVVGGASLGALRALELSRYGMVGIGEIFEWYRDGIIEADDEVAIRHGSEEDHFRPSCEALVNIRKTLQLAHARGIISRTTEQRLIGLAKQMHYTDRSYHSVLRLAQAEGLSAGELPELTEFLRDHSVNQKKADAIKVLEYIADLEKNPRPFTPDFELQFTARLDDLMDKDTCHEVAGGIRLTPETVVAHASLLRDGFDELKDRAATNRLILELAHHQGVTLNGAEIQEGANAFREFLALRTEGAAADWRAKNHLTVAEQDRLLEEWLLIRKMKTVFGPNNRDVIRQLRLEQKYEETVASIDPERTAPPGASTSVEGRQCAEYLD